MKSLNDYAVKYGTDKKSDMHNYVAIYEPIFSPFRNDVFNFLEIGINRCYSHKMWRDYFPNATIYGIDNRNSCVSNHCDKERMVLTQVDQGDKQQLFKYVNNSPQWRVIVDDGSHKSSHQKLTFEVLWDSVEPGGYYIIEDTHTSFWDQFKDCEVSLVQRMLSMANEVSSPPYNKYKYKEYFINHKTEDLSKYQNEVEYIQFRMGFIILKKRGGPYGYP